MDIRNIFFNSNFRYLILNLLINKVVVIDNKILKLPIIGCIVKFTRLINKLFLKCLFNVSEMVNIIITKLSVDKCGEKEVGYS